jgi:hypothetical protein
MHSNADACGGNLAARAAAAPVGMSRIRLRGLLVSLSDTCSRPRPQNRPNRGCRALSVPSFAPLCCRWSDFFCSLCVVCVHLIFSCCSVRSVLRRAIKSAVRTCPCASSACSGRSPSSRAALLYASFFRHAHGADRVLTCLRALGSAAAACRRASATGRKWANRSRGPSPRQGRR